MDVYYVVDEFYPYYELARRKKSGLISRVDLPEDVVKRYLRAQEEFEEAAEALHEAVREARGED